MAHGRSKQLWDHTCSLVVALAWSKEPLTVEGIHPYYAEPETEPIRLNAKEGMAYLKGRYGRG